MSVDVATPNGPARVTLTRPGRSRGLVLLGHSAGGGIDAPDLRAVHDALLAADVAVGLVEQPYRVAGRRAPAPAAHLDAAMAAMVDAVRVEDEPVVLGGRSSGARVACRSAAAARAVGVLALAFPLRPPWRPEATRLPELVGSGVPVLVVQGERDRFGSPDLLRSELDAAESSDGRDTSDDPDASEDPAQPDITLLPVPGADHSLSKPLDLPAVVGWVLARLAADGDERRGSGQRR